MHAPRDALDHGVKITGATLFVVDEGVDTGPIIAQVAVPVLDDDDVETLHERIKTERARHAGRVGRPPGARARRPPDRHHPRRRVVTQPVTNVGYRPLRRALVSVYDKTGLDDLARDLHAAGVSIVSTGSTAKTIEAAGVPVTPVEELTGFPECLDGRVKTLHPRVHAGILADLRLESHVAQLAELDIEPFDLVVVNLYPFLETVVSGATPDECVEQIDIGGPSMVRAAAKNHPSVAVVVSPDRYDDVRDALAAGGFTLEQRKKLAAQAFAHTAAYDVAVASWFGSGYTVPDDGSVFPDFVAATWDKSAVLRYGENPHQAAALYRNWRGGLATAEQLHGKEMSYNNYVDTDAARRAAHDFDAPAVAIIKHANPCGIAIGADIAEAHARAHACDPVSAFGGVIAANRAGVGGDGRAGGRGVHRGHRGARLRARRPRGAAGQEEHPHPAAPGGRAPGADRDAPDQRRRADPAGRPRRAPTGDDPSTWTLAAGEPADEAHARRPRLRVDGGARRSSPTRSCWPRTAPRSASAWAR